MNIAIVAPKPVPAVTGGAEILTQGLVRRIGALTPHRAELVTLPSPESNFAELLDGYEAFSTLDLSRFDLVVSTKYPSWMAAHPHHVCYMLHRLRGLYDTYHLFGLKPDAVYRHPRILALQRHMAAFSGRRDGLEEFFGLARRVLAAAPEACGFPGPLTRQAIHWLDGIGLAPGAVEKYAAISGTVARRADYFPRRAAVQVIHPPTDLEGLRCGASDYLFTASRLDGPKRVALLIQAMRHVRADIPLKIVGTGPEEARLRALADGDPRIEFLGFVPAGELADLYADARAVLFVPDDEDYGLITIEAMASGKPVITTVDSGGPTELVVHGETGLVVAPDPAALGAAMDSLVSDPAAAAAMGLAGQRRAAAVNWPDAVAQLLAPPERPHAVSPGTLKGARRHKISVVTSFPIYPPVGGGQNRVFHLYRHLARSHDIEVVCLTVHGDQPSFRTVAPGLTEIRVPQSFAHHEAERALMKAADGVPVTDVALPRLAYLTPSFAEAVATSARHATATVACHPYAMPILRAVSEKPLWYEAQDVEVALKASLLAGSAVGKDLLAETARVEYESCRDARLVMVCADTDGRSLQRHFGIDSAKLIEVPNGVDLDSVTYVSAELRGANKRRMGLENDFVVLFIGSWHHPNIEAVERILGFADAVPDIDFLVMGSVGRYFDLRHLPRNVRMLDVVTDDVKDVLLSTVDCAINPMESGSGTNLKMMDYMAAGVPVLTTPHGMRGLSVGDEVHVRVAAVGDFPVALRTMQAEAQSGLLAHRIASARQLTETLYSWDVIAERFLAELEHRGELPQ